MTTTTNTGVADTELAPLTEEGAIDAFASLFGPDDASKKKPSDADEGEETTSEESTSDETDDENEASEETPEDKDSDEESEENEETEESTKKYGDDETFVKIKVGEEEHEVPVKDLKRLFGQEAALTKKSQEVAEQRKAVEAEQTAYGVRLTAMKEAAKSKADQFRQINWWQLAKDPNIPADQLEILQREAQQAFEQESFLNQETQAFVDHVTTQTQQRIAAEATETIKTLGDATSPYYIEGWSKDTYAGMVKFATDQGVPANIASQIVDAPTLKLLHMAMAYAKGQTAKKVQTVKSAKDKTPKKIIKTSSAPATGHVTEQKAKAKKAMQKLSRSGSEDDAIDAFMARMTSSSDDE